MAQAEELRPLTLGELLDKTFSLYRSNFVLFAGIAIVPGLFFFAMGVAQAYVQAVSVEIQRDPAAGGSLLAPMFGALAVLLAGFVFYAYAYFLSMGATVVAVSELHLGRSISIRDSYRRMRGLAGRVFNVLFSTGVRIMLGLLLMIIPGIMLAAQYSLALPAAVLENLKTRDAIKRSKELTAGTWGRILMILALNAILTWAASAVLHLPMVALGQLSGSVFFGEILGNIGELLATVLAAPVYAIAMGLQYYDARVRKEAFDLQHMMQALDAAGATPAAEATPAVS